MAPQNTNVGNLVVAVERPASPTHKPPVLLIHGMFGGAWYWAGYQALLAWGPISWNLESLTVLQ